MVPRASFFGEKIRYVGQVNNVDLDYDCPVCADYLLPPIYQCCYGHTLCNQCEAKLQNCPICRNTLPKSTKYRCLILEKIVTGLIFHCRNRYQGCLASLKYPEIKSHAVDCEYMELPICRQLKLHCHAKHTAKTIAKHLETNHGLIGVNCHGNGNGNDQNESLRIEIRQSVLLSRLNDNKKPTWKPHYFNFSQRVLFVTTNFDLKTKCFQWNVFILGSAKSAKDIRVQVQLLYEGSTTIFRENQRGGSLWKTDVCQSNLNWNDVGDTAVKFKISLKDMKRFCRQRNNGIHSDDLSWVLEITFALRKDGKFCIKRNGEQPVVCLNSSVFYSQRICSQETVARLIGNWKCFLCFVFFTLILYIFFKYFYTW